MSIEAPKPVSKKSRTGLYIGIVLTVVIVIGAIIYFGYLAEYVPTLTKPIHHIDAFLASVEGDFLRVQFALQSESLESLSADGNVRFAVYDKTTNGTLYETEFTVKKSDFKYYQTVLGTTKLAYLWSIPLSSVEKCMSYGVAELTFETADGKHFSDINEYVILPEFTEEEIEQMLESEYDASASMVDKVLTTEDFEITVVKMGVFSKYTYIDVERMFRVDLKVKNLGSGTKSFSTYNSFLTTTEGLQYDSSYYGTFSSGDITGGSTKEGYLLFDEVPELANITKIIVSAIYIFDLVKDETYTLMEMYENMYLQSAIAVQQTITKGDFSITLLRVGHFTHSEYDTWGDEVIEFRVDLEVTSISSDPEYLFQSDIVILDDLANQYNYEYGGTLALGEIFPGVTREGYVLFPTLDENANRITVVVSDTGYPEDVVYEFTVNL